MPFAHFQVPASGGEIENRLNEFLGQHSILKIDKQYHGEGANAFWLYCVEFQTESKSNQPKGGRGMQRAPMVDYKKILSPEDFRMYLKLHDWRKTRAAADKIDAHYTIFTNAQLAEIAEKRCQKLKDVKAIAGVGETRIENHSEALLEFVKSLS